MEQEEKLKELQKAADYFLLKRTLTPWGIGTIICGLVTVFCGISVIYENKLVIIPICIGMLVTVLGIWVLISPSTFGIILEGSVFLVGGILGIVNYFYLSDLTPENCTIVD